MGKTARLVLKIVGASLALAAVICLIVGSWGEWRRKKQCVEASESDDFADAELCR